MLYFKPVEFFHYEEMDHYFLELLNRFRKELNAPVKITSSNEKAGHLNNSYHYKNRAIDFICDADKTKILFTALKYFKGVGYYTDKYWHIDNRKDFCFWIGINIGNQIDYKYDIDSPMFKKHFYGV